MKRPLLPSFVSGTRRLSLTGPGLIAALGVLALLLTASESLVVFALASLPGVVFALVLHFINHDVMPAREDTPGPSWGPNMSKITFSGAGGLIFALGSRAIFFVALPEVRWFLALSLPLGIVVGTILHFAHRD